MASTLFSARHEHLAHIAAMLLGSSLALPECAAVSVAGKSVSVVGSAAGAAVSVGGAVVGSTVRVAGKVVEKTIDVVAPGPANVAAR